MRLLAIVLASSVTLAAGEIYAQAPAPATQKPPAPAAPATQKPAAPVAAAPTAPAPKFQDGFKYAYVNMAAIAAQSNDGRTAAEKLKAF
jgi:hypothetical protein